MTIGEKALKNVLQKAVANGFYLPTMERGDTIQGVSINTGSDRLIVLVNRSGLIFHVIKSMHQVIFSHQFAKGLWGTQGPYHLSKMAVAINRLAYLKENSK